MKTLIITIVVLLLNINITKSKDGILILKPEEFITKTVKKQNGKKIINRNIIPIQPTKEIIHLMDSIKTERYSNIPLKGYKSDSDGGVIINIEKVYRLNRYLKIQNKIKNYKNNQQQELNKIKYLDYTIIENIS